MLDQRLVLLIKRRLYHLLIPQGQPQPFILHLPHGHLNLYVLMLVQLAIVRAILAIEAVL